jgi:hypothetical protein
MTLDPIPAPPNARATRARRRKPARRYLRLVTTGLLKGAAQAAGAAVITAVLWWFRNT